MIIPDINILLYSFDEQSQFHDPARQWWQSLTNNSEPVGISWVVAAGFVRLMTNPTVVGEALDADSAVDIVDGWFSHANVAPLNPGERHSTYFRQTLKAAGAGSNRVNDAHIAALAIENDAELHSNDNDFARFPGLRWRNPLRV